MNTLSIIVTGSDKISLGYSFEVLLVVQQLQPNKNLA